ncbi:AAA family ATPase [Candidatus Micrarchaeota archaeon]|nr:AAA family ATPase [Candidatus Micrarchaeota archaeon]
MPSAQQQSAKQPAQKSMAGQKVAAYVAFARQNEKLWGAFIVFLGTFFLLGAAPFYPVYLIPFLALLCGLLCYLSRPPFGTLLGVLLAFPAIIYQSSVFGWLFLLVLVVVLFEVFENWLIISVLEILIAAPFSFGQFPFLGWITIAGMAIATLYFGSKKSILISVPSVLVILLLSSLWLVQNSAYMPLNLQLYQPGRPELMFSKGAVGFGDIGSALGDAFGAFLSFENIGKMFASLSWVVGNIFIILFSDSGLVQLAAWVLALYAVSVLSARISKRPQLVSSLALLITVPFYYGAGVISGTGFNFGFLGAIIFSIAVLGIMEQSGITISREQELERKDKMKAYGKFGMADMGVAGGEKLADVGGYEDVKTELRESILVPLEKKEIAYAYGIKPPSGVLLFGPPGTGKTMLMRALAREMKYNFIEVKCSQIISMWLGESEKNIAEVFANARKTAPTVLFFDEIDSIGTKREEAETHEAIKRILTTMLQEMDGAVKSKESVIVIGATNVPNKLDPALLRPGRFDKIIYMHLPDKEARKAIFNVSAKRLPLAEDIDFDLLAKKTERFSGADIKNIVTEAKRLAAKEAAAKGVIIPLRMEHFISVLKSLKPSVTLAQLEDFERFRMDFERRVGAAEEKKPEEKEVKWEDVAGLEDVKKALLEAIEIPLLHEDLMKKFKVKPSKGILLFGPPGTGKTLIVKAAANELNVSFQSVSGAEVMKRGYLQAVTVIKEVFNRGRENTPAIIFVDEIETFAPARGTGASEIIGQFLTEMDGLKELKGVVVIAATNKPDMLDTAILRPGRFDKIFYIPPPDKKTREQLFAIHLGEFAEGVALAKLAELTPDFTGADIASACQEAKMTALRAKIGGREQKITTEMLVDILKRRRPSVTKQMLVEYTDFLEKYGERK